MKMNPIANTLFLLGFIAVSVFGQSTVVTFSEGVACGGNAHPMFTTTAIDYKVTLALPAPGAGNPQPTWSFADIRVAKRLDACSIALYSLLFRATNVPTVVISHRNAANQEQFRVTLINVHVTSAADTSAGEELALSFTRIELSTPTGGATAFFDRTTGSGG